VASRTVNFRLKRTKQGVPISISGGQHHLVASVKKFLLIKLLSIFIPLFENTATDMKINPYIPPRPERPAHLKAKRFVFYIISFYIQRE
jgi:hypothetical protein